MDERRQEPARWYALCAAGALDKGAIHRTELHGEGLVVWRADDGRVNVWEDRCPHRGVRLSLGHHRGDTLQCQYHGWRFASGEGACRAVPAHPHASAPPIHATTWPAMSATVSCGRTHARKARRRRRFRPSTRSPPPGRLTACPCAPRRWTPISRA
ncbi:Rieske 2Fe-2S domain-containing protein [Paraburkholderia tropica]|uniref:Rieske 2Fe-2S domain-containing protein n=1 Tax=Paraburkholderia tropica TaxID=92647 RepID=UPI001590C116|nr:Rieske 2Fe-2S domain-containing protein [Paraburkholderia tropica]